MIYEIELPTSDVPSQVYGAIFSVIGAIGFELGSRFDQELTKTLGENWFSELQSQRVEKFFSPFDPAFVLKEPFYNSTSPTRALLPTTDEFYLMLKGARRIRNSWSHYKTRPSFESLEKDLKYLYLFCKAADLRVQEFIKQIRTRIRDIVERGWVPQANSVFDSNLQEEIDRLNELMGSLKADQVAIQMSAAAQDLADVKRRIEDQIRPMVGQEWVAGLGTRKLMLIKQTRDLYDVEAKRSARNELAPDPEIKISDWLAVMPIGGEVHVSDDGAVAGFVRGVMRLIGYLGEEPKVPENELRGFFTLEEFVVTDDQVVRLDYETEPLNVSLLEGFFLRALDGAFVRVTTYGDVAYFDEELDGWIKFGTSIF